MEVTGIKGGVACPDDQ